MKKRAVVQRLATKMDFVLKTGSCTCFKGDARSMHAHDSIRNIRGGYYVY